jgi:hypothetical protein
MRSHGQPVLGERDGHEVTSPALNRASTAHRGVELRSPARHEQKKGVIARLPGTNSYTLTTDGMRIAVFYTKLHDRLLRPLTAANDPPAPLRLRQALHIIDTYVDDYIGQCRLAV